MHWYQLGRLSARRFRSNEDLLSEIEVRVFQQGKLAMGGLINQADSGVRRDGIEDLGRRELDQA